MSTVNKGMKFKPIVTNPKQFEELGVDAAIEIRNITNSEERSYLVQVCRKIIKDRNY